MPRERLGATLAGLQAAGGGGMTSSPACPGEVDLRFLYSAVALCELLGLRIAWEGGGGCSSSSSAGTADCAALHGPTALRYIDGCQTQEGGFSLALGGGEAHGASTYCALAARALLVARAAQEGHSPSSILDVPALCRWLTLRLEAQGAGMSGRAGKGGDACYTWWVGASVRILQQGGLWEGGEVEGLLGGAGLLAWVEQCRGQGGMGYGKDAEAEADPFHTCFALAGLALLQPGGCGLPLLPVEATLGLTRRALEFKKTTEMVWAGTGGSLVQ